MKSALQVCSALALFFLSVESTVSRDVPVSENLEGFGWLNASPKVEMNFLSPVQLTDLHRLKPPKAE